jgi:uncharacterized protein YndB with AHSA1/START domain
VPPLGEETGVTRGRDGEIEAISDVFCFFTFGSCNSTVAPPLRMCNSVVADHLEPSTGAAVNHSAADLDPLDRIDRTIDIDASAERVWDLVTRPGWWINEGTVDDEPDIRIDGSTAVVTHPKFGEFRLETVESRPPSYIAYRWLEPDTADVGTLVEFRIEPRAEGVTLSVAESGFSQLGKAREEWMKRREGNDAGWREELHAAKVFVEGP